MASADETVSSTPEATQPTKEAKDSVEVSSEKQEVNTTDTPKSLEQDETLEKEEKAHEPLSKEPEDTTIDTPETKLEQTSEKEPSAEIASEKKPVEEDAEKVSPSPSVDISSTTDEPKSTTSEPTPDAENPSNKNEQNTEDVKGPLPSSIKIEIPVDEPAVNQPAGSSSSEAAPASSSATSSTSPEDDVANDNEPISPTRTGRRSKRSRSIALSVSSVTPSGQPIVSSAVFIKKALTTIKSHRATSKNPALEAAVTKALSMFDSGQLPPPPVVFEPLRLVCSQTSNNDLKVVALDCIGKLFNFSYLEDPVSKEDPPEAGITPPPKVPLIDRAIKTVCDCFQGESTDPKVELQIIKALMAAVLNDDLIAHGATLLKAIRQAYTVFVLSHTPSNQTIAQATLSQMVNVIFDRVKSVLKSKGASQSTHSLDTGSFTVSTFKEGTGTPSNADRGASVPGTPTLPTASSAKLTLRQMETLGSTNELERVKETSTDTNDDENDLFAKDAFLVFRTLCRLSEKALEGDSLDIRSHGMRSKLLSLHLIHSTLKSHMSVFLSNEVLIRSNIKGNETFLLSVKDYICSTLARNAASINPAIFEISSEIFLLIVSNLRFQFKKEIEVFFSEIYFPITEMRTSTMHQKQYFLSIVAKMCNDPRALVEIYLNYDCDSSSSLNIYEYIIDFLVKLAVSPVSLTPLQLQQYAGSKHRSLAMYNLSLPPALAITNYHHAAALNDSFSLPMEHSLKMMALESLVAVLRSLITWSQRGIAAVSATLNQPLSDSPETPQHTQGEDTPSENESKSVLSSTNGSTALIGDDPSQFQSLKIKKNALQDGIRQFNTKPKRGIKALLASGLIISDSPEDIARFLLTTEGLDKTSLGEFLGEGDQESIDIMHAFVDLMDFANMSFVDALRHFLQGFRLPGESQKIERYMLKFAERYTLGNPGVFAYADTAYILAYSVMMLNTDLHSPQVKNRMTLDGFVRNNRGIDDGKDLPHEFLVGVYNEILKNEIKLLSEQHAALLSSDGQQSSTGFISNVIATVGRDLQREAYMQASREMSNKAEQLFKALISRDDSGRKSQESIFYIASHIEHVKPMFEVVWMSFLAGLSGPFQQSEDPEVIKLCLEGFKLSIQIACLFNIDLARISFVSALAQFTNLQNLSEMKQKNVDAIKKLLQTALTEGNLLKSSWKDILTCISQLERFQLISSGIEAGAIPDVTNARFANHRSSSETTHKPRNSTTSGFFGLARQSTQSSVVSPLGGMGGEKPFTYAPELAEELQSTEVTLSMDKIFTSSASLSGDAIVDFVKALTEVSAEEIQSSGQSEHPRMFSLQKMVDISYYNMDRVRFEWSRLWAIMGKQFDAVGCHQNTNVVFFALDSLRQLSIRFFDLDELSHFKFQKEFLEPFEYVMAHNNNAAVKDMVLQCLQQMVLAKSSCIKSGWKSMFVTFSIAAKQPYTHVVKMTFEIMKRILDEHLEDVVQQDSFGNMISCFSELAKNQRFQKPSLQSVELLKTTIGRVRQMQQDNGNDTVEFYNKYWFPILFALHDIIMNGEDLEVRSRALNCMFDTLTEYGDSFNEEFWDIVCKQLLFPTFVVLKSRSEMARSRMNGQDSMSVWLSTTMIQALRNMIALLSHYFETLGRMLDGFLDLLETCINQEIDTVSRIGASCLQQLIEQNVEKFEPYHWKSVVNTIEHLFEVTTAGELFGDYFDTEHHYDNNQDSSKDITSNGQQAGAKKGHRSQNSSVSITNGFAADSVESSPGAASTEDGEPRSPQQKKSAPWTEYNQTRQNKFRKTIMKCILQLLMIDTVDEILQKQEIIDIEEGKVTNGNTITVPKTSSHTSQNSQHPPSAMVVRKLVKVFGTEIYDKIPVSELLRILVLLRKSYMFAHKFNADKELRTNLWRLGFMKQLPNLLKQESLSAHVYISVLVRLYTEDKKLYSLPTNSDDSLVEPIKVENYDKDFPTALVKAEAIGASEPKTKYITIDTNSELKEYVEAQLVPMITELLVLFDELEPTDNRGLQAWTPVVVCVLEGLLVLNIADFGKIVESLYPRLLGVMNRDMSPTLRLALQSVLVRTGEVLFKGKTR